MKRRFVAECAGKKDWAGDGRDQGGWQRMVCGRSNLLKWPWSLRGTIQACGLFPCLSTFVETHFKVDLP